MFSKFTTEEKLIFLNNFHAYDDDLGEEIEKLIYKPENRIKQYIILNPDDIKILSCDSIIPFKVVIDSKTEPTKFNYVVAKNNV
jgi:hypothetical protein